MENSKKKKVLVIGPEFFGYYLSVEKAFKQLGYTTQSVSYITQVENKWERIVYHFSGDKEAFFEKKRRVFNNKVLSLYKEFRPDIVFIIQGSEIYSETVEKMKEAKKILWMMDSIFRNKRGYALRKIVDYIFVFERTDVDKLLENENIVSHFLPLALDEAVYYPYTNRKDEIDILFVGALYDNRVVLLERIYQEFKDYNMKVYGHYYSPFRRPLYHFFRRNKNVFLNKNISPAFVNELYNRSKICINIHHNQNKYGVNQRFFEISSSKSFQLVDRNGYITENFGSDEIATYNSEDELIEIIRSVLHGQINTKAFAEKAHKKVLTNHTFRRRMEYVMALVND